MEAETANALPRCEADKAARQFFIAAALTVIDSILGAHLAVERVWAVAGRAVSAVEASTRTVSANCFERCDVIAKPLSLLPSPDSPGDPAPGHYSRPDGNNTTVVRSVR